MIISFDNVNYDNVNTMKDSYPINYDNIFWLPSMGWSIILLIDDQ
jgi:hypothetical protein